MTKKRSDGEGSVYQEHVADCTRTGRCSCKWRGAIVVGYRGKRAVRRRVTASTKSGAATRLREIREQHESQSLPLGKAPTLEQWLNHCLTKLLPATAQRKGLRESSLAKYRSHCTNYLIPLLGHQRLDRLTADDIEDAWSTLAEIGNPLLGERAEPLSPATIHLAHTILVRCLKLAVQRKRLRANPAGPDAMDAPSRGRTEAEPLATQDWRRVLDQAAAAPNAARWTVALALGLRQGEALGLRWADVDLDRGELRVRQILYRLTGKGLCYGPPKTERSRRDIALPAPLVAELRRHRVEQNEERLRAGDHWWDAGLVFCHPDGRPIDPTTDRKRWHALLAAAGVAPIKLHSARHTAATILLLQGVDTRVVMDIMGWSQITTASNYQHAVAEAKKDAATKLGAAVWG